MAINLPIPHTTIHNVSHEENLSVKNKPSGSPPGSRWKRLYKHIDIHLAILGSYRGGLDFVKGMVARCPKVDLSARRSSQVCVITGGARGIGLEVVKILLQLDYTVVMGVRNVTSAEETIQKIKENNSINTGQVKILHLDLKSLQSVRQFATAVLTLPDAKRIDLLINNAGVLQNQYEVTEDNIECHFQVNYLSHFLLTNLLLPRIKETAEMKKSNSLSQLSSSLSSCNIINTTSRFHFVASLEFRNLAKKKMYEPIKCYSDAKLCQIMHAKSIHNQLVSEGVSNVHMFAVQPGDVPTSLWRSYGKMEALFHPFTKRICRTKEDAANVILYPALDPKLSEMSGGEYFDLDKITKPHPQALDESLRDRLWEFSMELVTKRH